MTRTCSPPERARRNHGLATRTQAARAHLLAALKQMQFNGVQAASHLSVATGSPAAHLESVPVHSLQAMAATLGSLQDEVRSGRIDQLTGLPLRPAGAAAIRREIQRARRQRDRAPHVVQPVAVAFLDVNNLKAVNDALGHAAGDILLRSVAGTLSAAVARRETDLAIRWGADEFVVLLPGRSATEVYDVLNAAGQAAGVTAIAELTKHAGAGEDPALPVLLDGLSTRIRRTGALSIGVSEVARWDDLESVIARADGEMYADKRRRKAGLDGAGHDGVVIALERTLAPRRRAGTPGRARQGLG